jgi:hypothetical protein
MDPVRNRFLYPSQLDNIAKYVARLGMIQDVEVLRRTPDENSSSPANAYGDDAIDYVATADSRRHWVKGWVYSTPSQVQTPDTGAIITINTYAFRCPVGTDILPGDEMTIDGEVYTVSDTTVQNTWKALINCNLRLRE